MHLFFYRIDSILQNYKDLVSQIKEQFPKDKDIQEAMDMLIGEGLENWSINNALEVAVQNKFDGALINQYNKSQVLEYAKQIIMSTMYQGKVKRGNPMTNKLERMNLPEGNKTAGINMKKTRIYNDDVPSFGIHFSSNFINSFKPLRKISSGISGMHILIADLLKRFAFCSGRKRKASSFGPLKAFIPSNIA